MLGTTSDLWISLEGKKMVALLASMNHIYKPVRKVVMSSSANQKKKKNLVLVRLLIHLISTTALI